MTTFIAAADETADHKPPGNFYYVGVSAPRGDWESFIAPAWKERVLGRSPRLPYAHATDMVSVGGRARLQLSDLEADRRLDEAAAVIRSAGSLIPVAFGVNRADFEEVMAGRRFLHNDGKRKITLAPDHLLFVYLAFRQLELIVERYGEQVERVDFVVERNGPLAHLIDGYRQELIDGLKFIEKDVLVPFVGSVTAVDKSSVPPQIADMLGWHTRNVEGRKYTEVDRSVGRRYWKMIEGGRGVGSRFGYRAMVSRDVLETLAKQYDSAGVSV